MAHYFLLLRRRTPRGTRLLLLGVLLVLVYLTASRFVDLGKKATTSSDVPRKSQLFSCLQGSSNCDRCILPVLELWPNGTRDMFVKPTPIYCAIAEDNWVYAANGKFMVSAEVIERHGQVRCQYTPIIRGRDDFHVDLGTTIADMKSGSPMPSDFFKANCTASDGSHYVNTHAGIVPVAAASEDPTVTQHNSLHLNILMIGFDSVSRMTWMRSLPNTFDFLVNHLGAVVLEGYNIVGDGTPAALLPILTGKPEQELPEARRGHKGATPVDGHPWIWSELKRIGYVTQFAEDRCSIGTFNYRMLGFKDQPVDHYMRTYFLETEKRGRKKPANEAPLCTGSLKRHVIFLNYARDLYRTYPAKTRKFSFLFHAELSHNKLDLLENMDDDIVDFLKDMNESGYLDDTLLVLMSDHGARFTSVRESVQGKLEERNPFMSIRFPSSFEKTHPEAMKNLRTNTKRLTTPFDIHATFLDTIDYSGSLTGDIKHRGISLLSEIPATRTCTDASIAPHWCACLSWTKTDVGDLRVKDAARALVDTINALTRTHRDKCEELTLADVSLAVRYEPNESLLKFKKAADHDGYIPDMSDNMTVSDVMYQVTITTMPGAAKYEATITHTIAENKFHVKDTDISRTNRYGNQPHCVMDELPHLRAYCYCKVQIE